MNVESDGDRGTAALELALGVGLLMVPIAMLVLSFGPILERRNFVRLAAAEASRAVVLSDGQFEDAMLQVAAMAAGHGYEAEEVRVGLCGSQPVPVSNGGSSACPMTLQRDGMVEATVEMDLPLVVLPFTGEGGRVSVGGRRISSSHSSFVDLYRSTEG